MSVEVNLEKKYCHYSHNMLHAAVSTVHYAGSRRRPLPHREEGATGVWLVF
jgi:hypothetical protein